MGLPRCALNLEAVVRGPGARAREGFLANLLPVAAGGTGSEMGMGPEGEHNTRAAT